jgi:hypothetical protein
VELMERPVARGQREVELKLGRLQPRHHDPAGRPQELADALNTSGALVNTTWMRRSGPSSRRTSISRWPEVTVCTTARTVRLAVRVTH